MQNSSQMFQRNESMYVDPKYQTAYNPEWNSVHPPSLQVPPNPYAAMDSANNNHLKSESIQKNG